MDKKRIFIYSDNVTQHRMAKKILIADSYSYLNKGDAGIILGMIQNLNEYFDKPEITLISITPKIDSHRYPKNIHTVKSPFRIIYEEENIIKKLAILFNIFSIILSAVFYRMKNERISNKTNHRILNIYFEADVILIAGGDKYYDYDSSFISAVNGFPKLCELLLGVILNKKIILNAQSGGPFNNKYKNRIFKFLFDRSDLITVREEISESYYESLNLKTDTILTADSAFIKYNDSQKNDRIESLLIEHELNSSKPVAGLTVREWHFPDQDSDIEEYLSGIESTIQLLLSKNYKIVLFPQVIGPDTDDRDISMELCQKIDNNNIIVLEEDFSVSELRYLIGFCQMFVGTRMHSNIFALCERVPLVAIAYRHKTQGIMRMFGLEDYVVDIDKVDDELVNITKTVESNKLSIKKKIKSKLPQIRSRAEKNGELIKRVSDDSVCD